MKTLHLSNQEISFLISLLTSLLKSRDSDPDYLKYSDDYLLMTSIISKLSSSHEKL